MFKFQDLSVTDKLQERIDILEKKITNDTDSSNEKHIVDSLLETNILIFASLSGRDKVNAIMKRLDELEKYLDPSFELIDSGNLNAKLAVVLSTEPELHEYAGSLQKIHDLTPVLNSNNLQEIPNLSSKLQELIIFSLQNQNEVEKVSEGTVQLIHQYNSIMQSMSRSFDQLNELVCHLENEELILKNKDEL